MSNKSNINVKVQQPQKQQIKLGFGAGNVKLKFAVMSGKGGVGKSLVTASLAVGFALRGLKVGILDADIYGPTIPKLLGLVGSPLYYDDKRDLIIPATGPLNIKVVSIDFLLPSEDSAVIWRGALVTKAIEDFLSKVDWGDLDVMMIDLPPGTGDAPLTIAQALSGQLTGSIIVSAPGDVSGRIVKKAIDFSRKVKVPVIGVIENMCCFTCPDTGKTYYVFGEPEGKRIAEEANVPFLGEIPLDPRISEANNTGTPFLLKYPDIEASKNLMVIIDSLIGRFKGELSKQAKREIRLMKLPGEEESSSEDSEEGRQ
ncbi:Mrp/NBP35 family ATP-binding protein [Caldivirga sp.]|jgi:ATP-binding protein involved in chromosome partitioning|uniref:Mrp/NBP35 family ATP-binding protein n=1 Tax=Caldivirga sp. TaxID=2080243 RepID=UPI0025BCCDC3|nr:Mrp/NBP35 family ATP-binding protein [Caldivirga sp.]